MALPLEAQLPLLQVSPAVQVPVSQAPVASAILQPLLGSQLSAVQTLPSLHKMATPLHNLLAHTSFWVQALPSLHAWPSSEACWQPSLVLHVSSVHGFLSSQLVVALLVHTPPVQESAAVHNRPSLHRVPLGLASFWHLPLTMSHKLLLQASATALQSIGKPRHAPSMPLQASPVVQALPSLHATPCSGAALLMHLVATQLSLVQALLSLHPASEVQPQLNVPWHWPLTQVSIAVQALLSLHCPLELA